MGAVGIPLLGLLGTAAAAGGAAYVTKKVVDGANTRAQEKASATINPQIDAFNNQASQQRALLEQQKALAQQQADSYAASQSDSAKRRRTSLLPGVATSNLGATLGNVGTSTLLGN